MADAEDDALWEELRTAAGTGRVMDVTLVRREEGGVCTRERIGLVVVHRIERRSRSAGFVEIAHVSHERDHEGLLVLHRIVDRGRA